MIVTGAAIVVVVLLLVAYFVPRHMNSEGDTESNEWPKKRLGDHEWEVEQQPDVKSYTIERVDGDEENIRALRQRVDDGCIVFERMDGYTHRRTEQPGHRKKRHTVEEETTPHEVSFVRDNVVRIEEDDWPAHIRFITVSGSVEQRKQSEDDEWSITEYYPYTVEEVLVG